MEDEAFIQSAMNAMEGGEERPESNVEQESAALSDGIWPEYSNPNYVMPDEIEVSVNTVTGPYSFPVTIIKAMQRKLYFGGYRNTSTHRVYHHAATQTPTENKGHHKENTNLRCRETQTYEFKSRSIQSVRESGTQMQRIDLHLDVSKDRIIVPRIYKSADELMLLKRKKSVEIQRVWRGYMARSRAARMQERIAEYNAAKSSAVENMERELRATKMKELQHRSHPRTKTDFARLFNELDQWRREETAKIKVTQMKTMLFNDLQANTQPGEERRKLMSVLLNEETKALQHIQQLKTAAHHDIEVEKTQKMLTLMAHPQKWQLSDGDVAVVHTTSILRAKELLDLFNALNAPLTNTNDRLEILLNVKWTIKEKFTVEGNGSGLGNVMRDLVDLVDREADLLNRGRPYASMENLRTRISHLFLQIIESPVFNPRAAEFIQLPMPPAPPKVN